jgi:PAS domain S-box-containing protein
MSMTKKKINSDAEGGLRKLEVEELRANLQRLSSIYDTISDIVFDLAVEAEGKYRFISINRAFCNVTGLTQGQVIGRIVDEVIPEPVLTFVLGKYKQAIARNRIIRWEETTDYPAGRVTGEVTIVPVFNDIGVCTNLVGSVHDITDRKQAEEVLKKSEESLADIFQTVKEGLVYTTLSGEILSINLSLERILEIPGEKLIGKNILDLAKELLTIENIKRVVPILTELVQGKNIEKFHIDYKNRALEIYATINRQTGRLTGVIRDITESIESGKREQKLNRILTALTRDESLSDILDLIVREMEKDDPQSICSILLSDEQGQHLLYGAAPNLPDYYNQAVNGIQIGNGFGSCGTAAFTVKRVIAEDILTDPNWINYRDLAQRAGLRSCWSEPILSSKNKVLGTFAIYYREPRIPYQKDIERLQIGIDFSRIAIERKRTEEEIAGMLSLLESTMESTADGIMVADGKGGIVWANVKFREMWGIPKAIVASKDDDAALSFVLDQLKEPEIFIKTVQELYSTPGKISFDVLELKDGRVFDRYSQPRRIGDLVSGRVWSFRDITERKQSEKTISMLAHAIRSISECVSITDMTDKIVFVNSAFMKTYKFEEHELLGNSINMVRSPNNSLDFVKEILPATLRGGWQGELLNRRKDGNEFPVFVSSSVIHDENGKPLALIGVTTDITERKRAEENLQISEKKYKNLADNALIGLYTSTVDGRLLYANNAMCKMLEYDSVDELLKSDLKSSYKSDRERERFIEKITKSKQIYNYELELITKNGKSIDVIVNSFISGEEITGMMMDISERKRAVEELLKSENRNKALLSAIPDLMFMFNREGVFIDFHSPDPRLLISEPDFFLGRRIVDVLPKELAELTMRHLDEVFKNGETSIYEYNTQVGSEKLIFESRIVACGKDFALSIVRDISDRKKMESKMIQSERLAALGEMSAGMAHEINQPLNTLSILFDNILFEARENHSVSEEYLVSKSNKIFNNILRIKNLIDHVREFSRSQESYIFTAFNINESILNALSMVSEQFNIAGIDLITSLNENLPLIKGNTYKFEQVILNLIINSKDALLEKKNGLNEAFPMFIKIRTQFDDHHIFIEVEDNGTGIKEDHMDKILQPFYTTKETGKGTGLGLSISYGLIKEINGKIDIKSKVLKGTTISIEIPLNPEKI